MQTNKALIGLVATMGVAIVVAVGLLVYGLTQKAADPSFRFFQAKTSDAIEGGAKGNPSTKSNMTVPLPPGTSVVSITRSGDYLMVHTVDEDDNSAVLFIDPNDGRIVRRIAFGGRR